MKAFEDWWCNSGVAEKIAPFVDSEDLASHTWIAALFWAFRNIDWVDQIGRDNIEEELKDEKL